MVFIFIFFYFFFYFFPMASALHFRPSSSSRSCCIQVPELPSSPAPAGVSALPLYPNTPGGLQPFPPVFPGVPSSSPLLAGGSAASSSRGTDEPEQPQPRSPASPRDPAPPRDPRPRPGAGPARSHWLCRRGAGPHCDVTISCRKVPICAGERRALGRTAGSAPTPTPTPASAPHRHRTGATSSGHTGPVSARGTRSRPGSGLGLGLWLGPGPGLGGLAGP